MEKLKEIYKDRLSFNSIDSESCVLDAMRLAYNRALLDVENITPEGWISIVEVKKLKIK